MKKKNIGIYLVFFLMGFVFALPLCAQQEGDSGGMIIYASGNGFEHIHNGETREYDLATDVAEGTELGAGDFINTYKNTFLEIQLLPSENVVKISENTSFRIKEVSATGGGAIELSYGRVRARVKKMAGHDRFSLEGPSMVAGVRGTDFGYDIIYEEESENDRTVTSVYCFEGEVEVSTKAKIQGVDMPEEEADEGEIEEDDGGEKAEAEAQQKIRLTSREMLRLVETPVLQEDLDAETDSGANGKTPAGQEAESRYTLSKERLSTDIRTYWNANDFRGKLVKTPVSEEEEKTTEEGEPEKEIVRKEEIQAARRRSRYRKVGAISGGLGVLFGSAALTLHYADDLFSDMKEKNRKSFTIGVTAVAGVSLTTSIFAYIKAALAGGSEE